MQDANKRAMKIQRLWSMKSKGALVFAPKPSACPRSLYPYSLPRQGHMLVTTHLDIICTTMAPYGKH